jgi:type I restriction enzyme M protein
VVGREEIAENEFNLNLPRYVDTFEPEKVLLLTTPLRN